MSRVRTGFANGIHLSIIHKEVYVCVCSGIQSCGTLEMWVTISEPSEGRGSQSTQPTCNLSYAVYPNN